MLRMLPKVWGIALAAIVAAVAFALWYTFQTTVGREVATMNLRVLADAVPYKNGWYMAVFNLGPAVNITGVWTDNGFEPLGRVLGMGQNATLQLADRPLKVQACAVGHASACELVDVAGWAVHMRELKRIPMANATIAVTAMCTWIDLHIYGAGIKDKVGYFGAKMYVIPTAFPLYVVARTEGGHQSSKILLPGESYSISVNNCDTGSGGGGSCSPSVSMNMEKSGKSVTASANANCAEHGGWKTGIISSGGYVAAVSCTTLSGEAACLGTEMSAQCGDTAKVVNGSSVSINCG